MFRYIGEARVPCLDGFCPPAVVASEFEKFFGLGINAQQAKKWDEAVALFEQAFNLHQGSAELLTALASALHAADPTNANGGLDKAIVHHDRAVKLVKTEHPRYPYFILNYCTALLNKDTDRYAPMCRNLLMRCPENPDCAKYLTALGNRNAELKKENEMEQKLEREIIVPEGAVEGTKLAVPMPDGKNLNFVLPAGIKGGQKIKVGFRVHTGEKVEDEPAE
jgi:tetratricopeptide (TPR) repeat protein